MKLKSFTPENCITSRGHTAIPFLAIGLTLGQFRLNSAAAALLNLSTGDQITFHQDEENPGDWYLEKVNEKGFCVRQKNAKEPALVFNNSKLARQIAESVSFKGKSGKCLVAGVPTIFGKRKLFGILTGTFL